MKTSKQNVISLESPVVSPNNPYVICNTTQFLSNAMDMSLSKLPGFPAGSGGKASACNMGDLGSIPGSGRSSGERNGNPLQCSCLESPMDRGACWAIVHGIAESDTTEVQ